MLFLLENAKEIMFLCFGFSALALCVYIIRSLVLLNRLFKKIDDLTDIFIEYIQKPLAFLLQAQKTFRKIKGFFEKK